MLPHTICLTIFCSMCTPTILRLHLPLRVVVPSWTISGDSILVGFPALFLTFEPRALIPHLNHATYLPTAAWLANSFAFDGIEHCPMIPAGTPMERPRSGSASTSSSGRKCTFSEVDEAEQSSSPEKKQREDKNHRD